MTIFLNGNCMKIISESLYIYFFDDLLVKVFFTKTIPRIEWRCRSSDYAKSAGVDEWKNLWIHIVEQYRKKHLATKLTVHCNVVFKRKKVSYNLLHFTNYIKVLGVYSTGDHMKNPKSYLVIPWNTSSQAGRYIIWIEWGFVQNKDLGLV